MNLHCLNVILGDMFSGIKYTEYAGLAVRTGVLVKFGTTYGRSKPEVGSTKHIEAYDRKGVLPAPQILSTSDQNIIPPTAFLRPIQKMFLLTVCS